jgi:hypothetical protein
MREPYFALELDCTKADPDACHIGRYLAFGPQARTLGETGRLPATTCAVS